MQQAAPRYAAYQRLQFDTPAPRVIRITMNNGKMNTADAVMHRELAEVWRDVDADSGSERCDHHGRRQIFRPEAISRSFKPRSTSFSPPAHGWREARDLVYNCINCSKPVISAMPGVAVGAGLVCGILRGRFARHEGLPHPGRSYAARRSGRRSRGDDLAIAVRHGQSEILPDDLRYAVRGRGRADWINYRSA